MDWLTLNEIEEAGNGSLLGALECSIKHHQQIRDAAREELYYGIVKGAIDVGSKFCALCIWSEKNRLPCMLDVGCIFHISKPCCKEWRLVLGLFREFQDKCTPSQGFPKKEVLEKAEEKLIALLESKRPEAVTCDEARIYFLDIHYDKRKRAENRICNLSGKHMAKIKRKKVPTRQNQVKHLSCNRPAPHKTKAEQAGNEV